MLTYNKISKYLIFGGGGGGDVAMPELKARVSEKLYRDVALPLSKHPQFLYLASKIIFSF